MATYDNAPPPADWRPDCRCDACDTCVPVVQLHTPDTIIRGEN